MKYMRFFVFISLMTMVLACNNQTDKTAAEKSEKKSLETSQEPAIPVYDTFSFHAYDITASYLAGTALPDSCEGADSRVFNEFWERYADAFDKRWKQYREQEMLLIQSWCRENLNVHDSVFYPFSGPDFNYLNIMFPDAVHSVLIGLEKPGSIPAIQDMQAEKRQLLLEKLTSGMQNNLKLGFFRTLGMKEKLNEELLNGTIPVMMVFLKRHGYELLNVYPAEPDGKWLSTDTSAMYQHHLPDSFPVGVVMKYRKPQDSVVRELVYLSIDLTDRALDSAGYLPFIEKAAQNRSVLLKAASYLPHKPHFSDVHDAVMAGALQVITDPTGIPFSSFDDEEWSVEVYGEYGGPINLFKTRVQDDLAVYCEENNTEPLPFRFGYHPGKWLLIDAVRN